MRGTGRSGPDTALVSAACDGDRRALDALVADSLPLVYNIVGRALNGHPDVDDVVQETLFRVVRGLPGLRDPEAYRSWLVAIAVRQVRDHEQDRRAAQHRRTDLDTAEEVPDPASDFAAVTILRLGLTDQRREVAEATRWLDRDDRALLALWWLEETGELSRAELAAALGLSARHASVRVQRMKEQVQTAHTIVRALRAEPGCAELRALTWNWDGVPGPLWRKRLARHIRGCDACERRAAGALPLDRLLGGLPLLPLPLGFALDRFSAPPLAEAGHTTAHPSVDPSPDLPPTPPRGLLSSLPNGAGAVAAAVATAVAVLAGVLMTGRPAALPPVPSSAPAAALGTAARTVSATPPPEPPASERSPTPTRRSASRTPEPARSPRIPPTASAKKGVGVWRAPGVGPALARSGASWYYTWATHHDGITAPVSARFVPMVRAASDVNATALAQAEAAGPYLLGFNEPDLAEQANMSVEEALALWPRLMDAGRILGSPAVAYGGDTPGGWLDRFMAGAAERGYRVDFIALHWYGGDFRTEAAVARLKSYLQAVHRRYRKPIWLTEYALIDFSRGTRFPSDAQQAAFVTAANRMLASLPYVQRHAWFGLPATENGPGSGLFRADGTPTLAGRAFQKAR
ncbi:glycosyl hydrolase [Planomonospora sphaerica]|uniref:Glycosyl hydrolase n=1 Tax=Planomonospora sphaerica TaxID=161355 RepID=A0A171D9K3_9ACTN|nr:sigma-70 family RNA polymerase sigma factor [Planomonospora sphaerica]GAT67849.1 glycosyl hydrolase [Planomonospora sphaerica]